MMIANRGPALAVASVYLAPLAGRGRDASKGALRARGTLRKLNSWREPLTP
jgi:hypothetical protein